MATVLGLNVKFAANTAGISKGTERTAKQLESVQKSAKQATTALRSLVAIEAGKILASGFMAAGRAISRAFSSIGTHVEAVRENTKELIFLAQQAGTTTQTLQRMAAATSTVGVDQEKLADILKDVNDRVGDFLQTGGGPMADFFEKIAPKIGVTAKQFKGLSGPQALQLYVSSLQKANLNQQEFTFYLEAMASDSTRLIPLLKDGGKELEALGSRAERLGIILGDDQVRSINSMNRALGMVGKTVEGITGQVLAALADEVTRLTDDLLKFVEEFRGVGGKGGKGIAVEIVNLSISGLETFLTVMETVGKSLLTFADILNALTKHIAGFIPGGDKAFAQKQPEWQGGLDQLHAIGMGRDAFGLVVDEIDKQMGKGFEIARLGLANVRQRLRNDRMQKAVADGIEQDAGNAIGAIFARGLKSAISNIQQAMPSDDFVKELKEELKVAFEEAKQKNEKLADLYKQRDDIERQRLDNLARLNTQALEVADIRAGGIGQFIALATGREDPAIEQAREQNRQLREINQNIRALGGVVEITGGA